MSRTGSPDRPCASRRVWHARPVSSSRRPAQLVAALLAPGLVAGLVTGLVIVLSACTGGDGSAAAPSGTTAARSGDRAQCVVADPEGEIILHPGTLSPDSPTRLVDAVLDGSVNLEVVERDVVRFTGNPTISGIVLDYPPMKNAGLADSLADWDQRRPLRGAEIGPRHGQQAVLVAVRLDDPSQPGHVVGTTVTSAGSGSGSGATTAFTQPVLVKPHGTLCTVRDYDETLAWAP